MFINRMFILGVLYFSAATAQGPMGVRLRDSYTPYRAVSVAPEVRIEAHTDGGAQGDEFVRQYGSEDPEGRREETADQAVVLLGKYGQRHLL